MRVVASNCGSCAIVTSHNHRFVDRIVTHILAIGGDRQTHRIEGTTNSTNPTNANASERRHTNERHRRIRWAGAVMRPGDSTYFS